jgi:hypothetical protein
MTISSDNISFVLSGGSNNSNPKLSIGGQPSSTPILGSINNLFSNITSEEASAGKTDYRCFYVFNDSQSDTLYSSKIYIFSKASFSSSKIEIGIATAIDRQSIEIIGPISSGSVVLAYEQRSATVSWGGSPSNFQNNLLSQLASIGLSGITSVLLSSGNTHLFSIAFEGALKNKNHSKLAVQQNNLVGSGTPVVTIRKTSEGQPINSIAPLVASEKATPSGVVFSQANSINPISIGSIGPGEGFPVWVKRTTPTGASFKQNEYFTIRLLGSPWE